MKQSMTAAEGAAEERRLWIRMTRKLIAEAKKSGCEDCYRSLNRLLEYGEGRTKRNHAKQGGL